MNHETLNAKAGTPASEFEAKIFQRELGECCPLTIWLLASQKQGVVEHVSIGNAILSKPGKFTYSVVELHEEKVASIPSPLASFLLPARQG